MNSAIIKRSPLPLGLAAADKRGNLEKRSGGSKLLHRWQGRHFQLQGPYLSYYRNENASGGEALGIIDVRHIVPFSVEVHAPEKLLSFRLRLTDQHTRKYKLRAASAGDIMDWSRRIEERITNEAAADLDVTDTNVAGKTHIADSEFADLVSHFSQAVDASWTPLYKRDKSESDNIAIYRRPVADAVNVFEYLTMCRMPYPASDVFNVLIADLEYKREWDPYLGELTLAGVRAALSGEPEETLYWEVSACCASLLLDRSGSEAI
jgi:hypothetical protein